MTSDPFDQPSAQPAPAARPAGPEAKASVVRYKAALRKSIRGMLPKGPLGRQQLLKLQVYAGPSHPHAAQTPTKLEIPAAKAR